MSELEQFAYKIAGAKVGLENESFAGENAGKLVNVVEFGNELVPSNDFVLNSLKTMTGGNFPLLTETQADGGRFQLEFDGSMHEYTSSPYPVLEIPAAVDQLILEQYILHQIIRKEMGNRIGLLPFSVPPFMDDGYRIALPQGKPPEVQSYYNKMLDRYGLDLVYVGQHIHFAAPDELAETIGGEEADIVLCRLGRDLVADVIALSASSPFYRGEMNGRHSERILHFPRPDDIDVGDLYTDKTNFDSITKSLIDGDKILRWPNHLYTPVRPKGNSRIELRSPDLIHDRDYQIAVAYYFQLGLSYHIFNFLTDLKHHDYEYSQNAVNIQRVNEEAAATEGPNAVVDKSLLWGERKVRMASHVGVVLEAIKPLAREMEIENLLDPLNRFSDYQENPAIVMKREYKKRNNGDFNAFISEEIEKYQRNLCEQTQSALMRINQDSSPTSRQLKHLIQEKFSFQM